MTFEVNFWGLVFVSVVLLAALGVDLALTHLLRETRKDLRDSRIERDGLRVLLLDLRLELARHKAARPAAQTEVLPPVDADATAVDQAVTETQAHTVVLEATATAERAGVPPILTARDVELYMPADEPVHDTAELERWQPLAVLEARGRERERRDPLPEILPEPLAPAAQTEVLEPVEVSEDDDPPQDEVRVTGRGDDSDDPPTGGRALTPFGMDRPPSAVGYRYPWRPAPARPSGWRPPGVPPREELPADWQRRFHRAVAYIREPIRVYRTHATGTLVVRRLWSELMASIASVDSGPGTHRRSSDVGGRHRSVTS